MLNGLIAVIVAYLIGSIPSAYIVTRLLTGKDIRHPGEGNAGARNIFQEIGLGVTIPMVIFDVAKGVAAVVVASWLLGWPSMKLMDSPQVFVLAAGLAVIAGHIWSIYLKFSGGNGLATAMGVLAILMTRELLLILGLMLLFTMIVRNLAMSLNISLFSLPVLALFRVELRLFYVVFSLALLIILVIDFMPTAKAALARAGGYGNLLAELLRRNTIKR